MIFPFFVFAIYSSQISQISELKSGRYVVKGEYVGGISIYGAKDLELQGDGALLDGGGRGTILIIQNSKNVKISHFILRNTGDSLYREDSAILIENSEGVKIYSNFITNSLFGIYVKSSSDVEIIGNTIYGKEVDVYLRGDGIRLWYVKNSLISKNKVFRVRDCVVWYSDNITFSENVVLNSRYGLHYMYSNNDIFFRNDFRENIVGAFLMYSKKIALWENVFAKSKGVGGIGIGLKDASGIIIFGNLIVKNPIGIYLANSPEQIFGAEVDLKYAENLVEVEDIEEIKLKITDFNVIKHNTIAFNFSAIKILPPSFPNVITENTFFENSFNLDFEGMIEDKNIWHKNYYSDYLGFDDNQDGFGDIPYKFYPTIQQFFKKNDVLRFFFFSPIEIVLSIMVKVFPFLEPEPFINDEKPKMKPDFYRYGNKNEK